MDHESLLAEFINMVYTTMTVLSRLVIFNNNYPIVRGILSYALLWPTSCIIQQTAAGKTWNNYDWVQAARFSFFGGLFAAPTFYAWVRITSRLWPQRDLKTAIKKAIVDQLTFGPFSLVCLFSGMKLLEGAGINEANTAVREKFLPTYKVDICVWPVLQTINYAFVPEKNRVIYASACGLVWCCFLVYMHELQINKKDEYEKTHHTIKL